CYSAPRHRISSPTLCEVRRLVLIARKILVPGRKIGMTKLLNRRLFLETSGMAAVVGMWRQARALGDIKSVAKPGLNIGYRESGNPAGMPIILLHGFPDDIHAWDDVTPPLVKAGHRVLVPYLRGFGATRFRDPAAPRMAEQAAIGQDVIDFADAL